MLTRDGAACARPAFGTTRTGRLRKRATSAAAWSPGTTSLKAGSRPGSVPSPFGAQRSTFLDPSTLHPARYAMSSSERFFASRRGNRPTRPAIGIKTLRRRRASGERIVASRVSRSVVETTPWATGLRS